MVVPNVIGVLLLSGVLVAETKKYIKDLDKTSDESVPVVKTKQDK